MDAQRKLMTRVKHKTDAEKLTINSMVYFISDTAVFVTSDLALQTSAFMMAWIEGELLKMKALCEFQAVVTVDKAYAKSEKEAMIFMLSDGTVTIVSSKDPKGIQPQIVKQKAAGS